MTLVLNAIKNTRDVKKIFEAATTSCVKLCLDVVNRVQSPTATIGSLENNNDFDCAVNAKCGCRYMKRQPKEHAHDVVVPSWRFLKTGSVRCVVGYVVADAAACHVRHSCKTFNQALSKETFITEICIFSVIPKLCVITSRMTANQAFRHL